MQRIVAVVGPTAVGKTSLGIAIAESVNGEIVSADSRQVYRGLDIGSGKVTSAERRGVPHHLIDVADPHTTFTAADFVRLGRAAIAAIAARGAVPIVVGGTGFYGDALVGRVTLSNVPPDKRMRRKIAGMKLLELQSEFKRLDPTRYAAIDIKNSRRLIRAIEIALYSKDGPTDSKDGPLYDMLWIGLTLPPSELKERIRTRLFARMSEGMLDEVGHLHGGGLSFKRMEGWGLEYRYMARHLQGQITESEMLEQLEKEIIAYAKRQMTWFRKNKDIRWFKPDEREAILAYARSFLD